ncbi:adhesion G protein-coupled receptor B2 isoform X1 [Molothrus ater]|uniref:adhesion G protein-coupled receptor B2 isoform X1 n=2 Tax=Icteridae TaxID=164646 RepID=UPI00174B74DC|nr:adhesion G protein-coupled receptor B2 isoform X1 [Molothrus ater]XP_036252841.1 adhesion G protein-coupled receptor B2 isoform X1 [Molothrus ater]XP_036252842.1 adhesion G protein-coupled receptor B2 isoform X1 [Molothrus ater]
MTAAGPLLLAVISSVLWLTRGFDPAPSACSALASGVLYGSFSLKDLFPTISSGCSWTLENPDPTKYSLYLRFNREEQVCTHFSPMVLPLDHYLANYTCDPRGEASPAPTPQHPEQQQEEDEEDEEAELELCEGTGPFTFLHFDKNFVQLCLAAEPEAAPRLLEPQALEFRFVEVLLINNNNSSQFTCSVLCRWLEECLQAPGARRCGFTHAGCSCQAESPPAPRRNGTRPPTPTPLPAAPDCCPTELHPASANELELPEVPHGNAVEENQKVKTQWPRSADEPGVYMAQTGDPAAEEWSQWSVCSLTCGQGSQVRTRSCVSSPYGTLCSGLLRETRTCNNTATCPVEGQWLQWGAWSRCSVTCANGTQQRTRRCSVSAPQGWAECRGAHADARECSNPTCPTDSKWGPWNHWSLCSKTCDTGWQRRFRMCEGTGMQGYPCEGTGEEVKTCNEKKCPAYHEMCKDEYVMLMTWKKTAAGEIIYNKCPPNATGTASRRCLLSPHGVAYWGVPSFARCVSHEYRYLHLSLREHLAKGQRVLAGEGMSQVVRSLLELMARKSYYSGDLLFSVDILRNVTDTFKRATYIPSSEDVQRFFQVVSYMVDAENREKWEDAQQVSPGSVHLMKVVEDFIHLVGNALKAFQSSLIVTDNLVTSIQREPVSAVSSDINFPMRGRRGMKDWARSSEDKLFIPREVLSLASAEAEESSHFVIGAVLYRTLGLILPPPRSPLAVTSKVLTVTVRPPTRPAEPLVLVELSHIINGTSHPQCVTWDYSRTDAGLGNWDTESCQTLETLPAHTKCQCRQLATFAVLAQLPRDLAMDPSGTPSVPLMIGCAVSCMALLTLLVIYAAFWRFIKSERSIILLNFCVSILASNILILVGQSQMLSKGVCTMTAAFLHFFFLSSFCWVLTEAWQSYLAVIGRIRTRLVRKRFLCLGWGLPALVVAVSVGFTRTKGYGTASYCWLSLEGGLLYAFVGPAAVIVLVNMLVGIIVFNKLMSRDGISDKSKKQRAGSKPPPCGSLLLKCTKCGVVSSAAMTSATASSAMASLWSSCVVLPLLALTWMSAVLAMTDRRSILFQVLFAVFNSVQGFVIITVHGFLRREVQDVVKCQMGGCRSEENENSPDSCKNGQVQILTDFEKDVDLACQTVLFKEVNTCNPATITGTLSRISLDGDEDPKLNTTSEGGLGFSSLPGNIPPASILVQVPKMTPNVVAGLTELGEPPAQQLGLEAPGPVYLCTESSLRPLEYGWIRAPEPPRESDYMMLPRRTGSLKPFPREEGTLGAGAEEAVPGGTGRPAAEGDAYPGFVAVDHVNVNLNQPYATVKAPYGLQFKQHPTVRQILASELSERSRTMPRTVPGSAMKVGSLERKRLRYSDLDFEKVMHTRKRHSELYHELNQKFHTLDRYRAPSTGSSKREKRWSVSSGGGDKSTANDVTSPEEQRPKAPAAPPKPWSTFKAMTLGSLPSAQRDRLELCRADWDSPCAGLDAADGDFQTEV